MSPKDAIDIVITIRDGVDPAQLTSRRVQAMHFLNHLLNFLHNYMPWQWTYTSATVTWTTGNRTVAVPTLFQEFSRYGGLYDVTAKRKLREISIFEMDQIRFRTSANNGSYVFAIRGDLLELPVAVSSNYSVTAIYRLTPDIITNHNDATNMSIPDRYCRSVVVPGLTRAMQQSKDDARPDWASELRDGLSQMCAQENPQKTASERWPIGIPGAW